MVCGIRIVNVGKVRGESERSQESEREDVRQRVSARVAVHHAGGGGAR